MNCTHTWIFAHICLPTHVQVYFCNFYVGIWCQNTVDSCINELIDIFACTYSHFLHSHIYTQLKIHTYVHTYTHTLTHTHTHIYIYICIYIYIYIHIYIKYIYAHTYIDWKRSSKRERLRCVYIYVCVCVCVCVFCQKIMESHIY